MERTLYDGLGFDALAVYTDTDKAHGWYSRRDTLAEYSRAKGELVSSRTYYEKKNGRCSPLPGRARELYYQVDMQGSIRAALDERGHVVESYRYDAFGVAYAGDFATEGRGIQRSAVRYGYTGKPYDAVTGTYDYGFRDYDPRLGRFQTVDPIRSGTNWYVYCGNEPVNRVDWLGLLEPDTGDQENTDPQTVVLSVDMPGGFVHLFIAQQDDEGNVTTLSLHAEGGVAAGIASIPLGAVGGSVLSELTPNYPEEFIVATEYFESGGTNLPPGYNYECTPPLPAGMSQEEFNQVVYDVGTS
jgi:RHS repeat-associated protein